MALNALHPRTIRSNLPINEPPSSNRDKPSHSPKRQHLLSITQLPPWRNPNPFILSGYRPESHSWPTCLAGWLSCHNETANIYSHLGPGIALLLSQALLYKHLHRRSTPATLANSDTAVISLQLLAAAACLLVSATYHTALSHSAAVARRWLRLDYLGVLALLLGEFLSGLYFGFYCALWLRWFYSGLIVLLSGVTATVLLGPRDTGPEYRSFRLGCLVCTGLSACAPIGHAWLLWGSEYLWQVGVQWYLLEGVLLVLGCCFWESRVPESLYPGRFDLWGHSHTIWHVFVALSVAAHVRGLLHALDYVYAHGWCQE